MMLPLEGRPDGKSAENLLNNALDEDTSEP